MKVIASTLSSIALLVLAGCGGGGGASSDSSAASAVEPAPVVAEAAPDLQPGPVVVEATSDLISDSAFDLASHKKVSVNVDISGMNNNQGYLSICALTAEGGPDYEDCYLRTALPYGSHQAELLVATNTTQVVSAVWFLDLSAQPVITSHDLTNNQLTLSR